ncbi:PulJ/GspJ family protein [Daejeonella oryzae]|uniref:PulJ/GspJ family protein n=1 Tax=Daejeonella oryzae TaxID=1122943 RepID=UPI0004796237|nr:prepilin-type N-terminal cleavage/methylation domain-containing protein [Daejeonella oryzae]
MSPNQNYIYKVKAFTIMELSVSMAISAIVIMMAYTVYNIVSKGYLDFNVINQEFSSLMRADELINRDFSKAELIVLTDQGVSIKTRNETILYIINKDEIIRKSNDVDTFKVRVSQKEFSFESSPVYIQHQNINEMELINNLESIENQRIDKIQMTILFRGELIPLSYFKSYSSSNLLNRKVHAFN